MHDDVAQKVEKIAEPIINNLGYKLVDVEFASEQGRLVLRLSIDKEGGGMTIDDCELISRAVEDVIEAEGAVGMRYNLEVSSPGLDRPLKTKKDFEKYRGKEIRLKTREPIEGRSNYKGVIEGLEGDKIYMIVDGMKLEIPIDLVSKARLVPDFTKPKDKS